MSINMRLIIDDRPVSLWQTPTSITYMCMITDNAVICRRLTGKKAKAAIARYMEWVGSHTYGVFHSKEEADTAERKVKEHIKMLEDALKDAKRIVVYAM